MRAPDWSQLDACIHALKGWPKHVALVLRYTGLRIGEVMLLRWSDVDLDHARLTVRKEIDKSRRGRVVPISAHLVAVLRTWERPTDYLITSGSTTRLRHRQPRAKDFAKAWARSGVPADRWQRQPTHAFRKGFKSALLQQAVTPDAIDYLQGHKLGGGARGRYIDPWVALNLEGAVAQVPAIAPPPVKAPPPLPVRRAPTAHRRPAPPPPPQKR